MVHFAGFLSWKLFGGLFLGWGIGANDSANIFGTAVATNSVRYKTAVWLIAVFVILGSSSQGWKLYQNYDFGKKTSGQEAVVSRSESELAAHRKSLFSDALLSTLAAALVVLLATVAAVPASTSQAAVGACIGLTIATGGGLDAVDWGAFRKMVLCWVLNPFGSALVTIILAKTFSAFLRRVYGKNLGQLNQVYTVLLLVAGCYGAFELGANNVVVTTGPYYQAGLFGPPLQGDAFHQVRFWDNPAFWASTLGGFAIALGALTYSKKVMYTVGSGITALDPFSAMITVFSHSVALMVFTALQVPVSSSQAIVGAVLGIGFLGGGKTISYKTLWFIGIGWLMTPLAGALLAYLLKTGLACIS